MSCCIYSFPIWKNTFLWAASPVRAGLFSQSSSLPFTRTFLWPLTSELPTPHKGTRWQIWFYFEWGEKLSCDIRTVPRLLSSTCSVTFHQPRTTLEPEYQPVWGFYLQSLPTLQQRIFSSMNKSHVASVKKRTSNPFLSCKVFSNHSRKWLRLFKGQHWIMDQTI